MHLFIIFMIIDNENSKLCVWEKKSIAYNELKRYSLNKIARLWKSMFIQYFIRSPIAQIMASVWCGMELISLWFYWGAGQLTYQLRTAARIQNYAKEAGCSMIFCGLVYLWKMPITGHLSSQQSSPWLCPTDRAWDFLEGSGTFAGVLRVWHYLLSIFLFTILKRLEMLHSVGNKSTSFTFCNKC